MFFWFFCCTTPHLSTIQRTGVFSKWLFSTNKFLYVNTTQNVYEHVKKINFVACGLLRLFKWGQAHDRCQPVCHPYVGSKLPKGREEERTTGPGRWHRGRHLGKEVFAILIYMMIEIICFVLLYVHCEKKYNFLLCGLLCCPRIQIYGFWILEVHQPTERGDSISVYV